MNSGAEFVPNSREIQTENKLKRIDVECSRRIAAIFPLQDQINILLSIMADKIGVTLSGEFARDRDRAPAYLRTVLEHRLAAEALKAFVTKNPDLAASLDVSAAARWPRIERPNA